MSLCLLPSLGFQHFLSLFFLSLPSPSLCPHSPSLSSQSPSLSVSLPFPCPPSLPVFLSFSVSLPPPPPPKTLQQNHIKRRQSGWDCQDDFSEWKFLSSRTENAYKCAAGILQTFCLKQKLIVMEFLRGFQCVCVYVLMLMLVCSLLPLVTVCTCRSPVNILNAVFSSSPSRSFCAPTPPSIIADKTATCRQEGVANRMIQWDGVFCSVYGLLCGLLESSFQHRLTVGWEG